jgi:hypothetical protein
MLIFQRSSEYDDVHTDASHGRRISFAVGRIYAATILFFRGAGGIACNVPSHESVTWSDGVKIKDVLKSDDLLAVASQWTCYSTAPCPSVDSSLRSRSMSCTFVVVWRSHPQRSWLVSSALPEDGLNIFNAVSISNRWFCLRWTPAVAAERRKQGSKTSPTVVLESCLYVDVAPACACMHS